MTQTNDIETHVASDNGTPQPPPPAAPSSEPRQTEPVQSAARAPISVVILTMNEEHNIGQCIDSCAWSDDIHVLDSGSTDRTCEIARAKGAKVHVHALQMPDPASVNPVSSWVAQQRNWAIDNIQHKYEWVFHIDADERFTPDLVAQLRSVIGRDPPEAGFYVPNKLMFMGRWLKRASGYPIYQMRLFHLKRMRFREFGHGQREDTLGEIGWMTSPYLHYNFSKGLYDWLEKHNRYSTLEARAIYEGRQSGPVSFRPTFFGNRVQRRRYIKLKFYPKLPLKWAGRFVWMYVFKLGFLDGVAGLYYCLLVAAYDLFTTLKLAEIKYQAAHGTEAAAAAQGVFGASAVEAEVDADASDRTKPARTTLWRTARPTDGDGHPKPPLAQAPARSAADPFASAELQQRATSPWTLGLNIRRAVWMLVRTMLFRPSFHNWYGWRRFLLRRLGARIGEGVRVRPSAVIEMPWNVEIGDGAIIGDHAIIYSLGPISIGRLAVISQYAHICAGTHDHTLRSFPLLTPPIKIGDECWVAADAFVGPGVTIGDRTVLGARASAFSDLPPDVVAVGNPAKPIKQRQFNRSG